MFNNDDFEMDNALIEFIKEQARFYEPEKDEDFEINQGNYAKLIALTCLLKRITDPQYDVIKPIEMVPRYRSVCVEVEFAALFIGEDNTEDLERIIQLADKIDFYAQLDGTLHIEIMILDVFEKRV